jgi:hypothetical protein
MLPPYCSSSSAGLYGKHSEGTYNGKTGLAQCFAYANEDTNKSLKNIRLELS